MIVTFVKDNYYSPINNGDGTGVSHEGLIAMMRAFNI